MNFQVAIKKITSVPQVWQMRDLSLVGKITAFTSSTFSKIVYLPFLALLLNNIIEEVKHIQKTFLWSTKKVKLNMTL